MNITKRDVLELKRRLKKNDCTFGQMCGCYVNSSKNVVTKFEQCFLDLEEEEFYKYLEIAKKTLSGTLGNNLLELEFDRTDEAESIQQYLLTLKASKLKNSELLDRLYERVMQHYACEGNYLILIFHDIYDVMTKTSDRNKLDESEEIYEYVICALCPVELSKPGLGYREQENRIGARDRDWVVGLPDLGFVYPAFSQRGSDIHAVMYYTKNAKDSHAEFIENVLGCVAQRTATEEKLVFESIVKDSFGEDEDQAELAFLKIQKNLNGMVADQPEEESLPPIALTPTAVSDVISDIDIPAPAKEQFERSFSQEFGQTPPIAQNLLDPKLVAVCAQRERTIELEQQVSTLKEQLAQQTEQAAHTPWEEADGQEPAAAIVLHVPEGKAGQIKAQVIDGQKFLVIPVESGECAQINGVEAPL